MRIYSINLGGGGGGSSTIDGRAGTDSLSNATQTHAVTFSSDLLTTNYAVIASITNTVDGSPIFLQIVDTIKASTGFTVTFNAPTDSANYKLEYIVGKYV